MKRILVTGATGTIGRQVVSQLLSTDVQIRAITRDPAAAGLPSGVEVVRGDLTDPASLDRCLDGVDAVFLVWTAPAAAVPAAVDRIARQARRIVLLTAPHKTPHPLFQQTNPMAAMFVEIERRIEASDLQWTFLRPGMFAANALSWWGPQIRSGDVVRWPYADVPTAPVHERDVAAVAVRALLEEGHEGAEYVLTGPESLTHREQVATIGEGIGRPLRLEEISPEEARREIPFPAPAMDMLLKAWAAALGHPALVTSTVAEITGRPARTFREWVGDHAGDLRA
ncbi:MAG TPA: NAD(P)H-binding protein [Thermoanaerobaculia bacterium]|nr:NAD(P)H-binding protein [Thermoanaerobaculia bacterium]